MKSKIRGLCRTLGAIASLGALAGAAAAAVNATANTTSGKQATGAAVNTAGTSTTTGDKAATARASATSASTAATTVNMPSAPTTSASDELASATASATNAGTVSTLANAVFTQPASGNGSFAATQSTSPGGVGSQVLEAPEQDPQDYVCTCTAVYSDGTAVEVDECSRAECPDVDQYLACQDVSETRAMPFGGCTMLETCDCDCRSLDEVTTEYYEDDVFIAGVPNLWQFDYRCGAFGENAVGCGPVAAAMMMYWWAQQGYDGLVDGFLSGTGTSAADRDHDWKAMVRILRDDYLDGGICVAGQYATTQGKLRDGIDAFIDDAGYSGRVDHFKVCDDCNRNESDEITPDAGLDIIRDELGAGRPVIMGFNVNRAMEGTTTLEDFTGETMEGVYSGELSNGSLGTIDHYVVITGYRHFDGQDVVLVNLGWEHDRNDNPWVQVPFLWRPAGQWLHLYTVDITSAPDGHPWCVIDRGIDATFLDSADLDASNDTGETPETVIAGAGCGILRELYSHSYYPTWGGVSFECDPLGQIESDIEESLDSHPILGTGETDSHGNQIDNGGAPTFDWIPPPGT